jgi:hypothetical protein
VQLAVGGDAQVHHDQAGDAARRVHHHEQEDQAEVEQPGLGQLRQQHEASTISTAPMIGPKKKVAPPRKVNSR